MSLPFRSRVEHTSHPLIERMNGLPRWVPFVAIIGLFVVAGVWPAYAWIPLGLIAVFIAWLLYLTWPRLTMPERLLRIAVLFFVVAVTVARALPQ